MENIGYLFGAGASANALPIVNQIPERLEKFTDKLKYLDPKMIDKLMPDSTQTYRSCLTEVQMDVEWLKNSCKAHASVDTLAKKLFIKQDGLSLDRLKRTLSIFLLYEQLKNKADMRYDSFLASVIKSSASLLPKNIKILSWNYDYQFELSIAEFLDKERLSDCRTFLNVKEKNVGQDIDDGYFTIVKLNGTCSMWDMNYRSQVDFLESFRTDVDYGILKLLERYGQSKTNQHQFLLSFAWEAQNGGSLFIERSLKIFSETDILVVIGYSFPFFNREIDRKIIQAMPKLRKVYFQSPDPQNLMERFEALTNDTHIQLVPKSDISQFLLPNEL